MNYLGIYKLIFEECLESHYFSSGGEWFRVRSAIIFRKVMSDASQGFEITKCELEEFLEEASFHEIIKREKWKVESELGN